jgi:hypothetical protein
MIFRLLLAFAGTLALAACNPGAQLEDAQQQITQIQALYNAGDARGIYRLGGDAFRKAAPVKQLEAMMTLFKVRLGAIESSKQSGFNSGFHNGITTTTVVMQTRFAKGEGTETYLFHGSGEEMELVGWTVNSPLLELSPDDLRKLTDGSEAQPPVQAR